MNDLVKFTSGGLPANPEDMVSALQNVGQSLQGGAGGMPFLRLLGSGRYAYGPENIEPEEGSEWALNPASIAHGWICWGDGEVMDERMVPYNQKPPTQGELPDLGHRWDQQVAAQLQCLNGEDKGTVVLYKGTSLGLRNAMKELINKLVGQIQADASHPVPVLELDCDSYSHKKYGETFFPVLNVMRWLSYEGDPTDTKIAAIPEAINQETIEVVIEEPKVSPKAAIRRKRKVKEQPATLEDIEDSDIPDKAPIRRRRRRAS